MNQRCIASSPAGTWNTATAHRPGRGPAGLRIGPESRQAWEGFGGCFNELGWVALSALSPRNRAGALRALFAERDGCGFTRCRLPIGASDYAASWYSHNEHAGDYAMRRFSIARDERHLLPYIHAAQALQPALSLFASPWSPPASRTIRSFSS